MLHRNSLALRARRGLLTGLISGAGGARSGSGPNTHDLRPGYWRGRHRQRNRAVRSRLMRNGCSARPMPSDLSWPRRLATPVFAQLRGRFHNCPHRHLLRERDSVRRTDDHRLQLTGKNGKTRPRRENDLRRDQCLGNGAFARTDVPGEPPLHRVQGHPSPTLAGVRFRHPPELLPVIHPHGRSTGTFIT